jgi:hypothetical protein
MDNLDFYVWLLALLTLFVSAVASFIGAFMERRFLQRTDELPASMRAEPELLQLATTLRASSRRALASHVIWGLFSLLLCLVLLYAMP